MRFWSVLAHWGPPCSDDPVDNSAVTGSLVAGRAVTCACDVPHALQLVVLMDIRDCQGTVPFVWLSRRLESVGKRGAWLWKQILFWLTYMVENAVVGMSVSLAEETAVLNGWTAFALASGRGGVWSCRGN